MKDQINLIEIVRSEKKKVIFNAKEFYCEFVKSDGTIRELLGTTQLKRIPEANHPKKDAEKTDEGSKPELIKVFDLKAVGWRSINVDNLIRVISL